MHWRRREGLRSFLARSRMHYDLVEKERELLEAWITGADRLTRLHMAVKFRWFTRGAYDMQVFLDAEWLRKLTLTLHK